MPTPITLPPVMFCFGLAASKHFSLSEMTMMANSHSVIHQKVSPKRPQLKRFTTIAPVGSPRWHIRQVCRAQVQLSSSPLWAWVSIYLAPTHPQPPRAHLVLTPPVPSCGSDITEQMLPTELNPRVALRRVDGTARGRSLSTSWLCHYSLWTLATSCPFFLGSGFSPGKWGCPGSPCGSSPLSSFGLKCTSSDRYSLTMVIKIAQFPSCQLSSLQNAIPFPSSI